MPTITNWWGVAFFCLAVFILPTLGAFILHYLEARDTSPHPHYNHPSNNPKETTHG
jgi:hypothetical protein